MWMERECHRSDSLADGCTSRTALPSAAREIVAAQFPDQPSATTTPPGAHHPPSWACPPSRVAQRVAIGIATEGVHPSGSKTHTSTSMFQSGSEPCRERRAEAKALNGSNYNTNNKRQWTWKGGSDNNKRQ